MPTTGADVPKLFYALALLAGLCGLPLSFAVGSSMMGRLMPDNFLGLILGEGCDALLAGVALFAVPHALLGAAFGYAWPSVSWRWGVWMAALPLCLLSLFAPALEFFLSALALTALPACAGAYAAARLNLRRTRVI
jgi:hypothetical protein